MNRKQRREMTRKIQSADLSLEVVHPDAAGIDIGNEAHYVAVPPDPNKSRCAEGPLFWWPGNRPADRAEIRTNDAQNIQNRFFFTVFNPAGRSGRGATFAPKSRSRFLPRSPATGTLTLWAQLPVISFFLGMKRAHDQMSWAAFVKSSAVFHFAEWAVHLRPR